MHPEWMDTPCPCKHHVRSGSCEYRGQDRYLTGQWGRHSKKCLDLLFVLAVLLSSDDGTSCHDHPPKEHLGSNVKPSICSNLQVKVNMAKRELESIVKICGYIHTSFQQENMSATAF